MEASNIKSRVNRLSVLSAITSVQQRLKLYRQTPPNGLVLYCGTVILGDNKEKKINIDFEPFRPINKSLYLCDSRFHTEPLEELLEYDDKYGFVIVDGNGALFALLTGNHKSVISQFSVELPKKHGRGGQSALRFARLRLEARHNYLRKVCEYARSAFIEHNKPTVKGLILGGSADFKNQLAETELLSPILRDIILQCVDISYGGLNGLHQAIQLSSSLLSDVRFVQERKEISNFFEQIERNTGLYCFGLKDTIVALEMGAVHKLLVWEDLALVRYTVMDPVTQQEDVVYHDPEREQENLMISLQNEEGISRDIQEEELVTEWLATHYHQFGTELIPVSDRSPEGTQFCRGFGGIGCLLRWVVEFDHFEEEM